MPIVKLKKEEFQKLTKNLSDQELSKKIGVSTTQLWRVRLPDEDPRHNDPGAEFIAGTLEAFKEKVKFEDVFYLEESLRARNKGDASAQPA